jgi:diguanylate cyclase (GGDEF)-like protein
MKSPDNPVHKLFAKLLAKATRPSGEVDTGALGISVSLALEEADRDRRRTDRSIALMIEELEQLNRSLEDLVVRRTSELHARERELCDQNLRFEAAIDNMSQGLIMFDAQGNVLICNQRYLDMYNLTPQQIVPGMPFAELLKYRAINGTFDGDAEGYYNDMMRELATGEIASRIIEMSDGRTISISSRVVPSSGWVATHEDITDRRIAQKKILHMAHHDLLTDLPNRVMLSEWLEQALAHAARGQNLAVMYIGLDHFKTINDTLGPNTGDELLRLAASRLRNCIRDGELVARVGGDEFAVVQNGVNSPMDAALLARRIRETLGMPYTLRDHTLIVDASIGITLSPGDAATPVELMKNADMAMSRAKDEGRGTYRFFEPEMDAQMQSRRTIELALRNALPNGEFELYYQPVVNLADNTVTSCEALIRWHHPERGMISPAEFIPIAEEIGLIVPLGEWVLRRACADAATWPNHIKVAVNLSPTQLLSPQLVTTLIQMLAAARLPAQRLVIEITEAVLMQNSEQTLATLHQLRELGAQIALDDFGTGYSSLSYLRSFPFDKLKIDRSFIQGLDDGAESGKIVRAITGLAHSLGMATVAEGVETEQQLEQVRALGCTELQGYLFSKPVPLADVTALFAGRVSLKRTAA